VYVAITGNDAAGDGTQENPWRTLQKAINECPKVMQGRYYMIIAGDGEYNERLDIMGFVGGSLEIIGNSGNPAACKLTTIRALFCSSRVSITGFYVNGNTGGNVTVASIGCMYVEYRNMIIDGSMGHTGIHTGGGNISVSQCVINNCIGSCLLLQTGSVYASSSFATATVGQISGTNNNIAIATYGGMVIRSDGTLPGATTAVSKGYGGLVINADGTFA
jgi:hypothetical protein